MFPQKKRIKLKGVVGKQRVVIAIIAVLVVASVVSGYTWLKGQNNQANQSITFSRVCDDPLIGRASTEVDNNNVQAILNTADEIKKIDTYQNDGNCVYLLARFALVQNNDTEARAQLNQLKKVYQGYSSAFTTPTMNPSELEAAVEFLEGRNKLDREQMNNTSERNSTVDQSFDGSSSEGDSR